VLKTVLQDLLATDYEGYLQHIRYSGCSPVAQHGKWILLDVSQLQHHEGLRASFILVNPQTERVYVFWLRGWMQGGGSKLYGTQPVPGDVSTIIVDELTSVWGHIDTFSWRDGAVQIGPRKR